jgi:hypothetical protein
MPTHRSLLKVQLTQDFYLQLAITITANPTVPFNRLYAKIKG